jgi:hypothetical protein
MAGLTNSILTQIANKRIAGKAMVSGKNNILQEELGSFVQQTNATIFATALPNNPARTLHLIQSSSNTIGTGAVIYTEFDLIEVPGSKYQNSSGTDNNANGAEEEVFDFDLGDTTAAGNTNTFHALQLKLPANFTENNPGFDTHAATGTSLGSDPFTGSFAATGSNAFQIVPEYVSTIVGNSNPYKPRILDHNDDGVSDFIADNNDIAFYLDTAAGILFVQNPAYEALADETNNPKKVRAFLYVGKYQSEIDGGDTVSLAFQGDDSSFSIANNATASFQSGSSNTISITATNTTMSFDVSTTFSSSLVTKIDNVEADITDATASIGDLVTSGSGGIYFRTGSSLTGSSIPLMSTASWDASGTGLSVDFNTSTNTFTYTINDTLILADATASIAALSQSIIDATSSIADLVTASSSIAIQINDATSSIADLVTASSSIAIQINDATASIAELVSSASAGIYFRTGSSLTGSSVPLMSTASWDASGTGLSVDFDNANNTFTYTIAPNTVIGAVDTSTVVNITSSYAHSASKVSVVDVENHASAHALVFTSGGVDTGQDVQLATDASTLVYFPGSALLRAGSTGATNNISLSPSAITAGAAVSTFNLLNADTPTINFGSEAPTINVGTGSGTVFFRGTASIDGDLIVNGTTTTLNTSNLLVEDRFILLNSGTLGSAPTNEGGLIVETKNEKGTAFYYDGEQDRWLITSASAHQGGATSITADITAGTNNAAAVVTVQYDGGNPSHTPFVAEGASTPDFALGQMYINNSEDGPCDSNIWIYS